MGAKVRPKEHIDARFVRRRAYAGGRKYRAAKGAKRPILPFLDISQLCVPMFM